MKKLLIVALFFGAVACQNPEEEATTINDSTPAYNEEKTLNTPPGVTTPDTLEASRMDSSGLD